MTVAETEKWKIQLKVRREKSGYYGIKNKERDLHPVHVKTTPVKSMQRNTQEIA